METNKGEMMAPRIVTSGGLKMIEGDDKIRAKRCMQNIQIILDQHDCELHPVVTITPMGNQFGFKVIAKPRIGGPNGKNIPGNAKADDGKAP